MKKGIKKGKEKRVKNDKKKGKNSIDSGEMGTMRRDVRRGEEEGKNYVGMYEEIVY